MKSAFVKVFHKGVRKAVRKVLGKLASCINQTARDREEHSSQRDMTHNVLLFYKQGKRESLWGSAQWTGNSHLDYNDPFNLFCAQIQRNVALRQHGKLFACHQMKVGRGSPWLDRRG